MINEAKFYKAKNLSEVLYHIENVNALKVYGGGTNIQSSKISSLLDIGENCLFLSNCDELKKIDKRERYIDFGCCVSLTQILDLGKANIPNYLYKAIETVANPLIRNKATIVGNICSKNFYHTLYSPLLAVDAKLEIHNSENVKIVPMSKFKNLGKAEVITKIRFPIIDWDIENFTRLGPDGQISDISSSFTFLSKSQKDTLIDVRIAFCGKIKIRSNELENNLVGSHLPLSEKIINNEIELASKIYDDEIKNFSLENSSEDEFFTLHHPMIKEQFLNLLRKNLEKLT